MMGPAGVVLVLAIGALLYFLFKKSIPEKAYTFLFVSYLTFLLSAVVVSEFLETNSKVSPPPKVQTTDFVEEKIINREKIDPSMIIEKRNHNVGEILFIRNDYNGATVLIERTGKGQIIEEILYKPLLHVNDYDFSDTVQIFKPDWEGNTVKIPRQVANFLNYVSYYDANLTNQFTKNVDNRDAVRYSTWTRLIVHLKVPKNIEVISNNEESTHFIDE